MTSLPRLLLTAWLLLLHPAAQAARTLQVTGDDSQRYALAIGNDAYSQIDRLEKAANDARAMGRALEKAGFQTTVLTNASRIQMNQAINQFVDNIAGGGQGVFFFAGHGVQINNQNFLLPIETLSPRREADLADQGVSLQAIQDKVAEAKAKFTLLVIDACRNNPLPKKAGRSLGGARGLAQASSAEGQMVVFSAGANQQALDKLYDGDRDPNGVFTREFLPWVGKPGVSIRQAVQEVRGAVYARAKSVNHDQFPAVYDQVLGDFYFVPDAAGPASAGQASTGGGMNAAPQRPVIAAPIIDPGEAAYWAEVIKAEDADSYAAYVVAYPNGYYVADANEWLEKDKRKKEAQIRVQEDLAWQKAQNGDDHASYSAYLKAWPNGRYAALAKLKLSKLRPPVLEPEMVRIPGRNYEMGKYEVTQAQWRSVMGNDPSGFNGCDDCPVERVRWQDVQEYLSKLNQLTGKQYRLPKDDEWKHACDGGGSHEYCGGNNLDGVGWYDGNSGKKTHPVGLKQPNGYGLYDMNGNVWEWMQDCHDGDCSRRMVSGGSWSSEAAIARAANRSRSETSNRSDSLGFRAARTLP
jgi:hypothetical protein